MFDRETAHSEPDLSGRRFAKLFVKAPAKRTKHRHRLWLCQCDCGTILDVRRDHLTTGHSTSCGCERVAAIAENGAHQPRDAHGRFSFRPNRRKLQIVRS
jgi:hypothetical protein